MTAPAEPARRVPPVLARRRAITFARLVANGLVQGACAVASVLLVRRIFDDFIHAGRTSHEGSLAPLGLGLIGLAVAVALARVLERVDAERLGQDFVYDVRLELYDQLSTLSPRRLQQRSAGAVVVRFVNDLTALRQWVSLGIARLSVASILVVATLVALCVLNTPLALGAGAVLGVGAAFALALGRPMESAVRVARRRRTQLATNVTEKISSIASVHLSGQTRRERRRLERQAGRLREAMLARARVAGGLRGLGEGTTALASATCLLIGVHEVASGEVSPGTVVAAMAVVGILLPQIRVLGRVWEYWNAALVSREKIESFLAMRGHISERAGAAPLERGPAHLVLYSVGSGDALVDVSGQAAPGERIAIVGPNGAGKSTLLALIARLLDPDVGCITLDGQDIRCVTLDSLHRTVTLVSAEAPLLRGTLMRNVRYAAPRASERAIERVIALCRLREIAENLPNGFDTRLTEGGGNLSVGQRQRVALARALLARPRLLLLDEADVNLDPVASRIVDQVVARFRGTVVRVTHERSQLQRADRIWHLDAGRLVECGSPAELLQSGGPTARLFRRPFRERRARSEPVLHADVDAVRDLSVS